MASRKNLFDADLQEMKEMMRVGKSTEKKGDYALLYTGELLDQDEQQRVVDELLAEAQQISSSGRKWFRVIYVFLGVLFFTLLGESFVRPFEMNHQRVFENLVPHIFFQVYYVCMCACFLLGGYAIHSGLQAVPRILKAIGAVLCSSMFLGWILIFLQLKVTEPSLYWLPGVPVGIVALAVYTDRSFNDLLSDVSNLESLKYDYKKA